jgi:AraC-like DNA-binding protein
MASPPERLSGATAFTATSRSTSSMANGAIVPHGIRLVRPAPALEPYVRFYGHRAAHLVDTLVVHPVHARAAPILDFEFGDTDAILYIPSNGMRPVLSPRCVMIGMQTGRRGELHISGIVDSFSILFQPDGLDLLFGLPAQELTDRSFDAESVFGHMIGHFHERLADCGSFEERVSVANQFLLQRALTAQAPDGVTVAARQMLWGARARHISVMANRAGLSARQFRRIFLQKVGVSPKLFARIARFEAALDRMARLRDGSWTEVAHRFGYYDQMHMVHEFVGFTGETPNSVLRHLESLIQQQLPETRSGCAPRSDRERWIL